MAGNYVTPTSIRATGITMLVLTTLIAGLRLFLAIHQQKGFHWDDGWLLVAYAIFVVITSLYLNVIPVMFKLDALGKGEIEPYPTVADDGLFLQKTFFVVTSGLWLCLWSVKFSLMAVYKKLMKGLPRYIMVWWMVIGFCLIVLAGAITSSMLSCSSMKAWFTAGACNTPRDFKAAKISLWYAFAVDIVTDLMIMILPIGLIWKLQMPLAQKLSIGGLFALGFICIAVAIIRVKELGSNFSGGTPSPSWLALWGIVESSIAVMIGCGPGLYKKAKAAYKTHKATYGSHGYARYNSNAADAKRADRDIPMYPTSKTFRVTTSFAGNDRGPHNDANSSQEELAATRQDHDILVTKSVSIGVQERDADSMRGWDARPHAM